MAAMFSVTDVHAAEFSGNFDDYKYSKSHDYYINYKSGDWTYEISFSTDKIIAFYKDSSSNAPQINYIFAYLGSSNSYYWNTQIQTIECEVHNYNGSGTYDRTYSSTLNGQYVVDSMDTNVPIYDTLDEARAWILEGGKIETEADIYFKDFKYSGDDNEVYFTWDKIVYNPLVCGVLDLSESFYSVEFKTLASSTGIDSASLFSSLSGNYNISVKPFVLPLFQLDLPDDDWPLFSIKFTPYIVNSLGNKFVGSPIIVRFSKNGVIDITQPDVNRQSVYDPECEFVNIYYNSNVKNYHNPESTNQNVGITWHSISHQYDYSSFTNPIVKFAKDGDFENAINVPFIPDGNIDYKYGNGYKYLNAPYCYKQFNLDPSYAFVNVDWYISITPTYTDGFTNYYGNPFVIHMVNYRAVGGGVATPDDPFNPVTDEPPTDWEDPDPWGTGDPSVPGFDLTEFDIVKLFTTFYDLMVSLIKSVGQIPSLVGHVFSFLPSVYTNMLLVGLGLVIILRILGR